MSRRGGRRSPRENAAPPASFSPTDLAGLTLWLRADMGITLNGSNVSAWADQSGNGNDVTQGTAANQPAYTASPALVDFDGTNDRLTSAANMSAIRPQNGHTMFAVVEPDAITSTNAFGAAHPILSDSLGNCSYGFRDVAGAKKFTHYAYAGGYVLVDADCTAGALHIVEARHDGATLYARVDGGAESSGAAGNAPAAGVFRIGMPYDGSAFYDGKLRELIMYSRALSSGECTQVRTYLQARHGL